MKDRKRSESGGRGGEGGDSSIGLRLTFGLLVLDPVGGGGEGVEQGGEVGGLGPPLQRQSPLLLSPYVAGV